MITVVEALQGGLDHLIGSRASSPTAEIVVAELGEQEARHQGDQGIPQVLHLERSDHPRKQHTQPAKACIGPDATPARDQFLVGRNLHESINPFT